MESDASLPRICPTCSARTSADRFDLAVRRPEGGERHFFGLLATLCRTCRRFLVDPEAALLYGIEELAIASAIQSDSCLRGRGADAG